MMINVEVVYCISLRNPGFHLLYASLFLFAMLISFEGFILLAVHVFFFF